jgi:two-component system NarL family sensor kinase
MHPEEKDIYKFVIIVAAVLSIIIAYFIISIIRQQRRTLKLNQEKIQAEISTMENERRRIASDLHDELGPLLSAVKLQISSLDTQDEQDRALIAKSGIHIDEIIRKLRDISNNLMPNTLIRKGLIAAIDEFIEGINQLQTQHLKISFEHHINQAIPKEKEIHLYRIMQEIIHNTLKHASASALQIKLKTADNKLILLTEDNGIGFDYATRRRDNSGLGLYNLGSRAEIMGGELDIATEPGKGMRCLFEIPL